MERESERRYAEHERRHALAMANQKRRHEEAMKRHDEAMDDRQRRHEESMAALDALIRRTAPDDSGD